MSNALPAYADEYPDEKSHGDEKKTAMEPIDVTLYHSETVGTLSGHPIQLLFPTDLTLIRVWTSPSGVSGIEMFGSSGTFDLFGTRTPTIAPHDFVLGQGDGIKDVYVRSGHWIDAVRFTTRNGNSSAWFGGQGGAETKFTGLIVGLVGEDGRDDVLGKFGVITANESGDYRGFQKRIEETKAQGLSSHDGQGSSKKTYS